MSTVSTDQAYLPTLAVLQGVKQTLGALMLPDPYTGMGKTFQDVRVYAHKNLGQALQDLLVVADRVALIVPTDFSHANKLDGRNFTSRRTLEFVVLIGDRVVGGTSNEAALGGPQNPGMVLLAELAITALAGADLGLPAVCIEPMRGQPMLLGASGQNANETFAARLGHKPFPSPQARCALIAAGARPLGPLPSPVIDNSGS